MENPEGAVQGNSQNIPTANVPRTRSTFPLKYHFFDTHRFGEYHPHYVEDGEKNDILPVRSSHDVRSYTLKAPLMQEITLVKDYFAVPMESILPLNWEKFYDNPVRGDDVSANVGPTVENFWNIYGTKFSLIWSALNTLINNTSTSDQIAGLALFRAIIVGEYVYSNGSLLSSLGCHGAPYVSVTYSGSPVSYDFMFDKLVDTFLSSLTSASFTLSVDGYTYLVDYSGVSPYDNVITMRHALSLMRDNPNFIISGFTGSIRSDLATELAKFTVTPLLANVPLNLKRLWAYQLVCAHYYSNDHIDFVYSAELYRQLIGNYLINTLTTTFNTAFFFTRNGIKYQYDYLSARGFDAMSGYITASTSSTMLTTGSPLPIFGYLSALFGYRRSLRYADYFTGSRAQPLAVGSTGVTVSGGTVDVVDITRNIQRQRFLNAVNRVRHSFEGYLQGIFGGDVPAPDYHNPFFLASTEDNIFGSETENTGSDQFAMPVSITSSLRSNGARYMLEFRPDRPSVLIGITHYDLPRVYGRSMERSFLHVDRFDMFNPFMQYIGDQQIYQQELGINPSSAPLSTMRNFAYTLRHMEYKQRYNQAAGAFIEYLPGYAFLAVDERGSQSTINPDWIKSVCSEFDSFFVSLNGWSNASYFHFIVDTFNDCSGSRPMAYAPSIL